MKITHQNCIRIWLKDGSTMQLYDVSEIVAYDAQETDMDFNTKKEFISHHAFTVRVARDADGLKPNGIFYIRSISPKTRVLEPSDEPGLAGLGALLSKEEDHGQPS